MFGIGDDGGYLGTHLRKYFLHLLQCGQDFRPDFTSQSFHTLGALAHGEVHTQQQTRLQEDGNRRQSNEDRQHIHSSSSLKIAKGRARRENRHGLEDYRFFPGAVSAVAS